MKEGQNSSTLPRQMRNGKRGPITVTYQDKCEGGTEFKHLAKTDAERKKRDQRNFLQDKCEGGTEFKHLAKTDAERKKRDQCKFSTRQMQRGTKCILPRQMRKVGQNCIYTPYMTVYLVITLPKIPYIHRIYIWFRPTLQMRKGVTIKGSCRLEGDNGEGKAAAGRPQCVNYWII